jgi:RimJ/RimL family protein N-acetyltransferase
MELITKQLILREFVFEDWPTVLAYQRDSRYLQYYEWTDRAPEDAQRFVQMFLEQQQEQPRCKFQLAVVLKDSGQLIGNCGIRRQTAGAPEADIGYEIAPDYWGHGYATEAARAIVQLGFATLQLKRIWAWCIADNVASARVLEKIGLKLESRRFESEYFKDRWWDTLVYALEAQNWHA